MLNFISVLGLNGFGKFCDNEYEIGIPVSFPISVMIREPFSSYFAKNTSLRPALVRFVVPVPDSARVVHTLGLAEDSSNYLLMHAMAPNVAGVIGSAVAAGILMGFLLKVI